MLFNKSNYILMIVGVVFILVGFLFMSGGGFELDENFIQTEFDESIYSFRRITLSVLTIMTGFLIEVYAIMKKPSSTEVSETK